MRPAYFVTLSAFSCLLSHPVLAAGTAAATPSAEAMAFAEPSPPEPNREAMSERPDADAPDVTPAPDASDPQSGEAENETSTLPGEFTAEVSLASDYIFRGITNTDHNPAIQGGVTYSVDLGLPAQPYVGFWGSNVDFDDGGEATVEIDALFGLSGSAFGIDWDIGGIYYAYPGAHSDLDYNYWEIPLRLSYALDENFSIQGQYAYSPDFFAGSGNAHYLLGGARWEHPIHSTTLAVEATTGHQWIEDNTAYGVKDYQDWRVAVSLAVDKITLAIAYTDSSLGKGDCFSGTNQCGPRVTFSLGASF